MNPKMKTKVEKSPINRRCIKCGCLNSSLKYLGKSVDIMTLQGINDSHTVLQEVGDDKVDLLVVTCDDCGYAWVEKPLA